MHGHTDMAKHMIAGARMKGTETTDTTFDQSIVDDETPINHHFFSIRRHSIRKLSKGNDKMETIFE